MKFEQVLQIYWTKGFLFNGRIIPFDVTLQNFFYDVGGLGWSTKMQFVYRFELWRMYYNYKTSFKNIPSDYYKPINTILSQMSTVNSQVHELVRFYHIRLYLIKSFRGRAQALGKPSRGQRTWSNAWSSYKTNKVVRQFVSTTQKTLKLHQKEEKINYKMIKKKNQRTTKSINVLTSAKKPTPKRNTWF